MIEKNLKCPGCGSKLVEFFRDYRVSVKENWKYFRDMSVFKCNNCGLGFAAPFPREEVLEEYYSKVYRKIGSPYYIRFPEGNSLVYQENQYEFMKRFLDFEAILNVLDIGPGYGFLLEYFRKKHRHLNLFAFDPDEKSLGQLKKYKVKRVANLLEANKKMDLIISSHSLEHMADLKPFFSFVKKNLSKEGRLFLEVPNCIMRKEKYFLYPYDEPHLFFFNEESLRKIVNEVGLEIDFMAACGERYDVGLERIRKQYKTFYSGEPFLKKIRRNLPPIVKKTIRFFLGFRKRKIYGEGGERGVLRVIIKK